MGEQSDLLGFTERAGLDNIRERIEVAGMIQREAQSALTLLTTGAGAALAIAATSSATSGILVSAFAVSVYLFVLSALLGTKVLGLVAYPAATNEPENLYKPQYKLDQVREWELENLQVRINAAVQINERRGVLLNRIRVATAFTPLVGLAAWAVAHS